MPDHVDNRRLMIDALRRELMGPDPAGAELDTNAEIKFTDYLASLGPWRQATTYEEILTRDRPTRRYGVGVLFPLSVPLEEVSPRDSDAEQIEESEAVPAGTESPEIDIRGGDTATEAEDDFDMSLANAYQPSSFGISFLAEVGRDSRLIFEASGGRYRRKMVTVKTNEEKERSRTYWLREPVSVRAEFAGGELAKETPVRLTTRSGDARFEGKNAEGLDLTVDVLSRPWESGRALLTVCLVNRSVNATADEFCLFQTAIRATVQSTASDTNILPYPEVPLGNDDEELSLALLYRGAQTFATGHGCAAGWDADGIAGRARSVWTECLPVAETPSVTPEVVRDDGTFVTVSMASLVDLDSGGDSYGQLAEVVDLYERWIRGEDAKLADLKPSERSVATRHLNDCRRAVSRMRDGLAYLRQSQTARQAFQLMNRAMLFQQLATSRVAPRKPLAEKGKVLTFDVPYQALDGAQVPTNRGGWRPFQIAFLLSTLRSVGESDAPDRRTVELIWFPTGGGKTEAYLGLAAFAMFKRRLENPRDAGVHVLMRYTLRLLTTQQFLRASALICAMEYLRRKQEATLGSDRFSIGIWLGGETTPNTREQAKQRFAYFAQGRDRENPFLLTRCPWCAAAFGRIPIARTGHGKRAMALTLGYARQGDTITFVCPDSACAFSEGLPVFVIDEDIYEKRPTLVIGTIDKFAMLAWRPEARALFGVDRDGTRMTSPPGLIIQDELHLISGPLGSIAGLYETLIEELCTDRRGGGCVYPKIVTSTATIRRYAPQIKALYARDDVALFPPPGLSADNSFFARFDRKRPGRVYVGVHATSLGSVQTEWVRTFAALLQAPMSITVEGRDPWWTLLVFFNSIREMGTAHTLFHSDVPDYLRVIWHRQGTGPGVRRPLGNARIFELTGGLQSGEVADAIAKLEVPYGDGRGAAIDICLASSIIEVGIDIARLSLMVVGGQPKTTSQYIQVTGRVGRTADRPGLIVTMYSPSKPRDRSHFERFRSYHERLYAQVEPTSVTPFSPPALERALHAVLAGYARQVGASSVAERPYPYPERIIEQFKSLALARASVVDPAEQANARQVLERRAREWRAWERMRWSREGGQDIPLLRGAGEYATAEERELSWPTPTSMRNVDAECVAEITTLYIREMLDPDA